MASYKDIRAETGLALSTISKYFNGRPILEANRLAIESASVRLNFQPNGIARSLRRRRTETVGVLLPALDNEFHLSIISGVESSLREAGISVLVASSPNAGRRTVELLQQQMVAGIVAVPSSHDVPGLLAASRLVPVVTIDRSFPDLDVDGVFLDNVAAGRLAVQHLVDHGHRRVAVFSGTDQISTMRERVRGARAAAAAAGDGLMLTVVDSLPLTVEAGRSALQQVLAMSPRPTAVVALNVDLTVGAVTGINESGLRLGRDVSMVGFDAGALAHVTAPQLTAVGQPHDAIAAAAAALLRARLTETQPAAPRRQVFAPLLIPGGSVDRVHQDQRSPTVSSRLA